MTLQDVSNHLGVSWDTVKEIRSSYLKRHYSSPSLDGVENIGIDEFAVRKGHVYKTIVVDLDSGRIIYVGDGKGSEALKKFWRKVKRKNIKIKHVATDLSAAFIASVMENCPDAVHVFDHFHVVKLMNEKLDDIRRKIYSMEKDINKRKVLKGTRYLLLGNGADIFDKQHKTRLENALAMNEPLSKVYVKCLDGWTHLVIMLFGVLRHFDSLREVEIGMKAEVNKLHHLGINYVARRSTLAEANKRRPQEFFANVYAYLLKRYSSFLADSSPKGEQKTWEKILYMMDSTTITLFDNILKGVGRHPKSGKKKGGMKVHTVMKYHVGVPIVVQLTSAAKHNHYLLKEVHLPKDATLTMDRAYIDYAQFQ